MDVDVLNMKYLIKISGKKGVSATAETFNAIQIIDSSS